MYHINLICHTLHHLIRRCLVYSRECLSFWCFHHLLLTFCLSLFLSVTPTLFLSLFLSLSLSICLSHSLSFCLSLSLSHSLHLSLYHYASLSISPTLLLPLSLSFLSLSLYLSLIRHAISQISLHSQGICWRNEDCHYGGCLQFESPEQGKIRKQMNDIKDGWESIDVMQR